MLKLFTLPVHVECHLNTKYLGKRANWRLVVMCAEEELDGLLGNKLSRSKRDLILTSSTILTFLHNLIAQNHEACFMKAKLIMTLNSMIGAPSISTDIYIYIYIYFSLCS